MTHADFFAAHAEWGWLLLLGLAVFPRITLLFVGGTGSEGRWAHRARRWRRERWPERRPVEQIVV